MGLFDYGSGNLHSASRAVEAAGGDVTLSADPTVLLACDALVVPGVGAFAACMAGLRAAGGVELIGRWLELQRPLLGICVGHQILFEAGTEHGIHTDGVGLWPGRVERLPAQRLPHMGWNTLAVADGSRLLRGVEQERFYFVHSYAVAATTSTTEDLLVSTSDHEGSFIAAIERDVVCSTQFHPEKSGAAGARLLRNWVSL